MKKTALHVIVVSALVGLASSGALAHEDYSEGGSLHWLEHLDAGPTAATRVAQAAPGSIGDRANVERSYELKDGSTLYVFGDGRMGMEDRAGRSLSMKDGHPMETIGGETIMMSGNELWRVERRHVIHRGG